MPAPIPYPVPSSNRLTNCLLLRSSSLLSLRLGTLLARTDETSITASETQLAVGSLVALGHVVALDVGDGLLGEGVADGHSGGEVSGVAGGLAVSGEGSLGLVDLVGGGVELLELAALAGEEDETGLVVLQAGDVGDQRLLGVVVAAVVDGNADGGSQLLGDAGLLQLGGGEAATGTHAAVVLVGRAVDDGTQLVGRTGGDRGGLCLTGLTTAVLATGLLNQSQFFQFNSHYLLQHRSTKMQCRIRTWSKYTRTRVCQSLRKSVHICQLAVRLESSRTGDSR